MLTILFWNLNKNHHTLEHLACLGQTHRVDLFLLAEFPKIPMQSSKDLKGLGLPGYREVVNPNARIRAITRLPAKVFRHRMTGLGRDVEVWRFLTAYPGIPEILIGGVHLPSKAGGRSDSDQFSASHEMVSEIGQLENELGHRNTVLIGDFNMHPYDNGMTSVTGAFAQMTRSLAESGDRRHNKRYWPRFYNPMWGLFGDRTPGPPGTYYWKSSHVLHNTCWSIPDQVLVRPGLIDRLRDVLVLSEDGTHPLMNARGIPDGDHLSDHLPVLFRLDL